MKIEFVAILQTEHPGDGLSAYSMGRPTFLPILCGRRVILLKRLILWVVIKRSFSGKVFTSKLHIKNFV